MGKFKLRARYMAALAAICAFLSHGPALTAGTIPYAEGLIGEPQQYKIRDNESLVEIARKFDLGFNAIVAANPGVDPIIPKTGTLITIPTAWILPAVSTRPAIVINIPELRLYYFPKKSTSMILTFPLGIGDEGKDTPPGSFTIIEKIPNPAWHVPDSIRAQTAGLPKVVPPGSNNPMGSHALRLSLQSVLIHGTNRPWGVGRRSSHGCLRLYPEDIVRLYRLVPKGMRVLIVNKPVKVGVKGKRVFMEVHKYEQDEVSVGQVMHLLFDRNLLGRVDFAKLISAVEEKKGMPIDITLAR